MTDDCGEFDRLLRAEDGRVGGALQTHAETCRSCREQLRIWEELSVGARQMHRSWDSPDLWRRIHRALAAESRDGQEKRLGIFRQLFPGVTACWRPRAALAALAVFVLAIGSTLLRSPDGQIAAKKARVDEAAARLLTDNALNEVEHNEAAYIDSIEKLSRLLQSKIDQADSPLLLNYREKLLLIDAAIAECKQNIERNRFNAYLRRELLAMYQDKQRTLQQIIKEN